MSVFKRCVLAGIMASCGSAAFALPQPALEIAFSSGRVTLDAADVPAADVLRAWRDTGHTQVTGIENLGQRHITLRLSGAPEETALTAIVGERSWFTATARSFSAVSESALGRIDILPAARSADVITQTPEQRYQYPQTSITPDVSSWAGTPSTSASAPRQQAPPETIYEYPNSAGRFGDTFRILPPPNASNEQPILRPGSDVPVPERLYEYAATPNMPGWMRPSIRVPNLPVGDGFIDGVLPGERVDLNAQRTLTSTTAATLNVPDTSDRPAATI